MNANNTFSFRVTCYKNGSISWVCDDVHEYPSFDRAVEGARYHAEYWGFLRPGSAMVKTEKGAKLYYENNADRFLTYYEVI